MLQKEKQRLRRLKEIQQMKEDHEAVQQRRAEEISALQEETQKITLRMQVENRPWRCSEAFVWFRRVTALVFRSPAPSSACSSRS